MQKINYIDPWIPNNSKEVKRYYINFDGGIKIWVHPNIFNKWQLQVGMKINVEELLNDNKYKWKNAYNNGSWEKENIRIEAVKTFVNSIRNDLNITTIGFGADSTEIIYQHPKEQGSPDLEVQVTGKQFAKIEVTGSEKKRGNDYWIRPDKIKYIQDHIEENIWIVLHYQSPNEMIYIKPDKLTVYPSKKIHIRGNDEYYVIFNNNSSEVKTEEEFKAEVLSWK